MLAKTVLREQLGLVSALRRGEMPEFWQLEAASQSIEASLASLDDLERAVLTDLFAKAFGHKEPEPVAQPLIPTRSSLWGSVG